MKFFHHEFNELLVHRGGYSFLQDEKGVATKWLGMGRLQCRRHVWDEVRD